MSGEQAVASPARHTNRLANETSPYLLQHAHNPVDWYPWGPEALERARREDKPIFLSIGYAACHWCHVMERESFEDETTATELNARFVAVKVDREERPDLDAVYMDAVQQMTGQGGWPMSVFLTPDGKPFYGGTYFPDERRHGMPSFREVLTAVGSAWTEHRDDVETAAAQLVGAIAAQGRTPAATVVGSVSGWMLDAAAAELERGFDARHGGWGGAPKFPQSMAVESLLRHHVRSGDARSLAVARRSLDAMAAGGIRDHLGGGFARYATDPAWLVPHFEKMLYDNAQLARVYLHAWQMTGDEDDRAVVTDTLDFVARDLRTPADGAFASSLDADTEGEEGATYVWDLAEVEHELGDEAALFAAAYGVRAEGNWEGHTILSRVRGGDELGRDFGLAPDAVEERLAQARRRLLERRDRRPQPARDGKVLASWNGLMIAAFAEAGRALAESRYTEIAAQAADFVDRELRVGDGRDGPRRLRRSWKDGRSTAAGVLEDHTHLADGFLALYEATFDERWFEAARDLTEIVLDHFADPAGGFYDTADDAEKLVTRPKGLQDNAIPSGNAMAASVLVRLAALTGEGRYRDAAERTLTLVAPVAHRHPTAFAQWLIGMDLVLGPIDEVAVVGDPSTDETQRLFGTAFAGYRPRMVVASSARPDASLVPLLHGRTLRDARPTAYVCHGFTCRQPVTEPEELRAQLSGAAAAG